MTKIFPLHEPPTTTTLASSKLLYNDISEEFDENCYESGTFDNYPYGNLSTDSHLYFSPEFLTVTELDYFTSFEYAVTYVA